MVLLLHPTVHQLQIRDFHITLADGGESLLANISKNPQLQGSARLYQTDNRLLLL